MASPAGREDIAVTPSADTDVRPAGSVGTAGARARRFHPVALLGPGTVLLVLAFLVPVGLVLARSFTEPPGGLHHYFEFARSPALLRIGLRSMQIAGVVTAVSLVIAYPYAYLALRVGPRARRLLLGVAGASLFISIVVRGYAWLAILDRKGVMNTALASVGLEELQVTLVHNFAGVVIGMVQYGVPFMILPLYDVMRRVNPAYLRAAAVLGAGPTRAFWRIFVPLTMPGVVAGCTIVFIVTLGYYILPALLGGPQNTMIGEFIAVQMRSSLEWGLGAAMASVLLVFAVITFVLLRRSARLVGGSR